MNSEFFMRCKDLKSWQEECPKGDDKNVLFLFPAPLRNTAGTGYSQFLGHVMGSAALVLSRLLSLGTATAAMCNRRIMGNAAELRDFLTWPGKRLA